MLLHEVSKEDDREYVLTGDDERMVNIIKEVCVCVCMCVTCLQLTKRVDADGKKRTELKVVRFLANKPLDVLACANEQQLQKELSDIAQNDATFSMFDVWLCFMVLCSA